MDSGKLIYSPTCITFIVRARSSFAFELFHFLPRIIDVILSKKRWSRTDNLKKLIQSRVKIDNFRVCDRQSQAILTYSILSNLFLCQLHIFADAFQLRHTVSARGFRTRHFLPPWEPITLPPSYKNGRPFGRWTRVQCARVHTFESREHTRDNVTRAHNI